MHIQIPIEECYRADLAQRIADDRRKEEVGELHRTLLLQKMDAELILNSYERPLCPDNLNHQVRRRSLWEKIRSFLP